MANHYRVKDIKVNVLVTQLCPTLCDPMTVARQTILSMEFSRQEYWSGWPLPSPGNLQGSSQPRNQDWVSCTARRFFNVWAIREALTLLRIYTPTGQVTRLGQSGLAPILIVGMLGILPVWFYVPHLALLPVNTIPHPTQLAPWYPAVPKFILLINSNTWGWTIFVNICVLSIDARFLPNIKQFSMSISKIYESMSS